ncbi:ferredoxin [Sphingopyxis witflariensis]|uniref:Ferredoxin n=2 Tax=Sphingopyxis witflariensis TaxID=173675 RepID=A0A246JTV5_9SPHN|nr:ferredoxin [Sphingopyxis witflariensis]
MAYKIDEIEGIGAKYAERLQAAGIKTTDDLLSACGSRKGRDDVAAQTGFSTSQLLKWANMADLMRISGVGEEYSELLEAAGVDTVKELATRNAENLAAKMKEMNEAKKFTRAVPAASQVEKWVDQAKTMDPAISH